MQKHELRFTTGVQADNDKNTLVGYPIVFNSLSQDLGGFREVVKPNAVKRTIDSNEDIRAYVEHDSKQKLGRRKANTARFSVDDKGVRVEIDIPDTSIGRDTLAGVDRGDYDGMSFRFATIKDTWDKTTNPPTRYLEDIVFDEVSVVGEPAYTDTSIALRSMNEANETNPEKDNDINVLRLRLKMLDV